MTKIERDKDGIDGQVERPEGRYGPTETQRIIADDFTWHEFAAEQVNAEFPEEVAIEPGRTDNERVVTYPVDSLFIAFANMALATERLIAPMYTDAFGAFRRPALTEYDDAHNPGWREDAVRDKVRETVKPFFTNRLLEQRENDFDRSVQSSDGPIELAWATITRGPVRGQYNTTVRDWARQHAESQGAQVVDRKGRPV